MHHRVSYTVRRCAVALVVGAVAVAGAACSSTGGAPRSSGSSGGGGTVDTPRMTVAMVTHGAPGDTFWDLVRKGAEDAAKKDNVDFRYSSDPQAPNQANLVQNAIDSKVDGIAVTMPNPEAIGPVAKKADDAKIPAVGLNAGMDVWQKYGLKGFFGQDEKVAGEAVGDKLKEQGARHTLCVIHEQGNSSQEARCGGIRDKVSTEILYVNGQDLPSAQATIESKLAQDHSIDWVMGLVAPVALRAVDAARDAGSQAKIATFDTNAELVNAIKSGNVQFAVDQQPYLQGYMAVDSLWLHKRNGTSIGGGRPVYSGPSFVDSSNVDSIADAAKEGLR